ncbi:hypothetical protein NPIL_568051 [Nephila pilipes]|uniref:Uncharacterized protein n=1 Tax=Nephila pilipes TaxID=299642 RepID=A0A8X6MHC8_NEPPI|nr:hypothetical protein NPIL_568051 [Nephila pilipes]
MRRVDQELFNAVEQGNLSEIEKCLNRGANVLARDSHHTVLHSAVRSDNGEVVKLVLNKIKETQGPYIDAKDTEGDTPLMWTAETGYVNAAQVLLEYGANVEVKNNNGMTALHWAAKKNHIGVLKLLIDKRANVNVQDNHGQTPSDCARKEGHGEIVGYLVFSAAEVFREQGKYNKAWQTYQEAFDIQEVVLGPNHLDTLRTRHNMARVLSDQGSVNAANYGRVLYSGWGENPPQDIRDKIDEFFNKKIPNDLFVIKEEHEDKNVYHYVLVDPDKKEVLQEQSKMGSAFIREIEDYGRILYSGWGQDPPESISDRIERIYFCTNERDLKEEFDNLSVKDDNALHDAARNGELEKVRYLIRKGANVNSADKNGWTSLHYAAYVGNLEVVKYLMDSWANLHVKDTVCGRKPVHIAAREGHIDVIELFLNRGVKVSDADENSWAPLHYAAWNGHQRVIEFLLSNGVDVDDTNKNGWTPLHCAAGSGNLEIVKFLIERGANINARNNDGKIPLDIARANGQIEIIDILDGRNTERKSPTYTSLHDAAKDGDLEAVKYLIRRSAGVNDPNEDGWTPLHCAASAGELEVAEFLISKGANTHAEDNTTAGKKPIHVAAIEEFLLDRGANVNDSDKDNWTPLHYAAQEGQLGVVRFLISKRANVHAKNTYGAKPIHIAAMGGSQEIIEFLLSNGASVDDTNKNGETPLHYAASEGRLEIVKFLIDKGANINAKDIVTGKKPIHSAAKSGHKNVIEFFLISRKINVDDTDDCSATPLQYAIVGNQLEIVKFLVNRGANIHNIIKDGTDEKPIHVAAMKCSQEIIEFLLSNGASVDDTNKNGETPLHYAASEAEEIVKF